MAGNILKAVTDAAHYGGKHLEAVTGAAHDRKTLLHTNHETTPNMEQPCCLLIPQENEVWTAS